MNAVSRSFRHRRPTDAVSTLFDVFADGTKRDQAKRKLNEDCRRPLSDENVSLMISLVLGVDKKKSLRRVCETSGIGTVLELGTRSRRYRSRQVGDTFTQQRRSFAYTAAVREPVVYSSSLRGACTNTAFCNGL